ncbi:hypothetical protein [Microbacterium sp. B35-04]|uniref:hypothetical protein n=1 Tax=Microbacterium sp. B35-04 TaxID=1961716 RepID=UPI0013D2259C|nr:hypothetical protein [Microbacterium sp. B35-04]
MRTTRVVGIAAAAVLTAGLTLGIGSAAVAAPSFSGGAKTCSVPLPYVNVQSKATGRVNHQSGVTVYGSWNNGSTYQWRWTNHGKSVPDWKTFLTGVGGDIQTGTAYCGF